MGATAGLLRFGKAMRVIFGFRLEIAASAAGIEESAALDATDEALAAQLLRPGTDAEHYDFMHALIQRFLS